MLDLRLPIGWFFIINAGLLMGVGIFQPSTVPFGDTRINLNLIWGVVMGVFGLFMAGLGYADRMRKGDITGGIVSETKNGPGSTSGP